MVIAKKRTEKQVAKKYLLHKETKLDTELMKIIRQEAKYESLPPKEQAIIAAYWAGKKAGFRACADIMRNTKREESVR
jgi:hypothetical protein